MSRFLIPKETPGHVMEGTERKGKLAVSIFGKVKVCRRRSQVQSSPLADARLPTAGRDGRRI